MKIRVSATEVQVSECKRVEGPESTYYFVSDQVLPDDFTTRPAGAGANESLIEEGVSYVNVGAETVELFADYRGWNHLLFLQLPGESNQLIISDSPFAFAGYCPIDWEILRLVPVLGSIPAPLSPVEGVTRLRPGERIVFQRSTLEPIDRENLLPALLNPSEEPSALRGHELIVDTLRNATAMRVQSTESPLVFLSGGFDSSLLVHLLQAVGTDPIAWTATYASHLGQTEGVRAAAAARHFGIPWTQVAVGEQTVGEHLQGLLDAMLEPFADVATLAEAALAWQAAREHRAPIIFEGEAMDSLMCGSYKFIAERYRKLLNPLMSLLPRESLVSENRASRAGSLSLKLRQLRGVLQGGAPVERHFHFNFNEREGVDIDPQVKARVWDVYKWYYDLLPDADTLTRLSCMTFFNIRGNRKLRLIERYADVRFELVYQDLDFVRLAFALPANRKVSRGYGKRIVREAFGEVVPPAVKGRAKLSFTFPVLDYFSEHEMRDLCETRLGDGEAIKRMVEEHKSGRADHLPFLWGLYVANRWASRYEEAAAASALAGSSP